MHSSACTSLKTKGVTVAVLYTNYNTLANIRYTNMVQPFINNIIPALTACASPKLLFQADSASDINNAMQQMFALACSSKRRICLSEPNVRYRARSYSIRRNGRNRLIASFATLRRWIGSRVGASPKISAAMRLVSIAAGTPHTSQPAEATSCTCSLVHPLANAPWP